jgi:hypothetical protein
LLTALEQSLLQMDRSCADPLNGDPAYDLWVKTTENDKLPSYHWKSLGEHTDWRCQRKNAEDMLEALRLCSQSLQIGQPEPLAAGSPRPRAELRMRPKV